MCIPLHNCMIMYMYSDIFVKIAMNEDFIGCRNPISCGHQVKEGNLAQM